MSHNSVNQLLICLKNSFQNIDCLKKRQRILQFKHLFYVKLLSIANKHGYATSTSHLKYNFNIKVTSQAVNKAFLALDSQHIEKITSSVLNLIPSSSTKRFLAVDGSWLAVNKQIAQDNQSYLLTNSSSYALPLLTAIYDLKNRVPIKILLTSEHDERKAFLQCLDSVKKGDCLIFDRGYPSRQIIDILSERKLDFVFRLASPNNMIKKPPKGLRIVTYVIKNTTFNLLTSLKIGEFDDIITKNLYHDRWEIEEWFKYLKRQLNGEFYHQTTVNSVLKELLCQQMLSVIFGYLELINPYKNGKGCLSYANKIIKYLAKGGITSSTKLCRVINHINTTLKTKPRPGRNFPRMSIQYKGTWYRAKSTDISAGALCHQLILVGINLTVDAVIFIK